MDEVKVDKTYSDAQFEMLMKERQAARSQRYGLIAVLGIVSIIGATVIVVALAMSGVFNG